MSEMGHNSSAASSQLRSVIERVENLDDEAKEIAEQRKEVLSEAKGNGFDVRAIRSLISLRKQDRSAVMERKAVLELYAKALGCEDLV
jgi:uncharacterized protein (UPF0335 family)